MKSADKFCANFRIPKQEKMSTSTYAERILYRHQQRFGINVRAGIVADCFVGPHVLPHRLTGNHCRGFLLHELPELLEDEPLAVTARMWYMRDGAPAHFSPAVREVLRIAFHDQWIGREGPTACPPRSPDLHPLDLYL
jgi:hypothetical protein